MRKKVVAVVLATMMFLPPVDISQSTIIDIERKASNKNANDGIIM